MEEGKKLVKPERRKIRLCDIRSGVLAKKRQTGIKTQQRSPVGSSSGTKRKNPGKRKRHDDSDDIDEGDDRDDNDKGDDSDDDNDKYFKKFGLMEESKWNAI
ncbi:hypothetical protein Ciccas_008225 [Cichlidogyrus casuarinus]|uniref:Uncharacterized protein n=1 Tax=Cichlidogyrus casuarinus TaxID=1844966 RepID=A0ABD2Q4R8_9PLAT